MRKASSTFDDFGNEWFSLKVGARETLTLDYVVSQDFDSTLRWAFTTEGYDIGFSVHFETEVEDGNEFLVQYERVASHERKAEGQVKLETPGKYVVTFDNSYSRTRAKTLNYSVSLTQVDPMEKIKFANNNNIITNTTAGLERQKRIIENSRM
jgi:hypothetical protein